MISEATGPGGRTHALDAERIARAIDPERTPTDEQRAMIEAPFGPLLVVAGAGAGKTETMSQRVLYAVANGVASPGEILGLTFTRKAAGELSERVRQRLRALRTSGLWRPTERPAERMDERTGGGRSDEHDAAGEGTAGPLDADRPRISTYNAFAGEIVSEFALRVGEDPTAALMTDARRWQLAEQVVTGWPEDLPTTSGLGSVIDAVLELSGALDEHLLTPEEAAEQLHDLAEDFTIAKAKVKPHDVQVSLELRGALMPLVEAFRARAREEGLVDFGGQVALAVRIAGVPEVRQTLRERYPVVMLDEYQDTSVAQVALLAALFGDGHAVTAVGDPQQAIYGWRGASAGAMGQFHERFASAGHSTAATLSLSTSWRNDRAVLDLANEVARIGGAAAGQQPALKPRDGAGPGIVLHHRAENLDAEVAAIADHLADTWNVEYRHWADEGGDATGMPRPATRSAAVLCRRRALFPLLARALEERGVPHRIVGRGGLLQQQEVADVRALLTVVAHPERGDAAVHLLHRLRLGAKDLAALHAQAHSAVRESVNELDAAPEHRERVDVREEATLVEVLSRPVGAARGKDCGDGAAPDGGSTVSSMDTLGRYELSAAGRRRLTRLLDVLDQVRERRTLPLGELVVLTERLLGLDVEVAARGDSGARAALDAFQREAVRFATDAPGAQLATFLDWLEQLERHERVNMPEEDISGVDTEVLLMTVHAAKGLEWDLVVVPELNEGRFPGYASTPAEDGTATDSAWLTAAGALPYPLRGDREDLPAFGQGDVPPLAPGWGSKKELDDAITAYKHLAGAHSVREDRNVAYVAFTRARSELVVTSSRARRRDVELPESRFVPHVARADGRPLLAELPVQERPGAQEEQVLPPWPADLLTPHRRALLESVAQEVRDAATALAAGSSELPNGSQHWPGPSGAAGPPPTASEEVLQWWREAELLLAERAHGAGESAADAEALGGKLSVTMLVNAKTNPGYAARTVLRPVPRPPSYASHRGTSLHEWIEQHYRSAAFVEEGERVAEVLPPAEDGEVPGDVQRLRAAFARSHWAGRRPVAVEEELTGHVDGLLVPGKADAIFDDEFGCAVVDWKTTAVPQGAALERVGLQLHAYRLAWARRTGRPIEEIAGVFVHLKENAELPVDVELPRLGERAVVDLLRAAVEAVRTEVEGLGGHGALQGAPDSEAPRSKAPGAEARGAEASEHVAEPEPGEWEPEDPGPGRWLVDLDE